MIIMHGIGPKAHKDFPAKKQISSTKQEANSNHKIKDQWIRISGHKANSNCKPRNKPISIAKQKTKHSCDTNKIAIANRKKITLKAGLQKNIKHKITHSSSKINDKRSVKKQINDKQIRIASKIRAASKLQESKEGYLPSTARKQPSTTGWSNQLTSKSTPQSKK